MGPGGVLKSDQSCMRWPWSNTGREGGDALTTDRSRNDPIEYTLGLEEGAWDGCPGDVVVGVVVGGASVVGVDVEVVGEVGVVVVLLAVVVVVATVVVLVVLELFVAFYNLSNIY